MTDEELKNAPEGTKSKPMTGVPGMNFAMVISPLDCTGCGSCVSVCPAKEKALKMAPIDSQRAQEAVFEYGIDLPAKEEVAAKFKETSVKGSQFKQPCWSSPALAAAAAKLLTPSWLPSCSATRCSSPTPLAAPPSGAALLCHSLHREQGRPWSRLENSLFEDNAEFGLGMALAQNAVRGRLAELTEKLIASTPTQL